MERPHGNFVDKEALVLEFERVMDEVKAQLQIQAEVRQPTKRELRVLNVIDDRLSTLNKKHARK